MPIAIKSDKIDLSSEKETSNCCACTDTVSSMAVQKSSSFFIAVVLVMAIRFVFVSGCTM